MVFMPSACVTVNTFIYMCAVCVSGVSGCATHACIWCVCLRKLHMYACVCVSPRPPPFRLEASGMVPQRSGFFSRWDVASVFKGHHAKPLHYLSAISYQFVCLIDFFKIKLCLLQGSGWLPFLFPWWKQRRRERPCCQSHSSVRPVERGAGVENWCQISH